MKGSESPEAKPLSFHAQNWAKCYVERLVGECQTIANVFDCEFVSPGICSSRTGYDDTLQSSAPFDHRSNGLQDTPKSPRLQRNLQQVATACCRLLSDTQGNPEQADVASGKLLRVGIPQLQSEQHEPSGTLAKEELEIVESLLRPRDAEIGMIRQDVGHLPATAKAGIEPKLPIAAKILDLATEDAPPAFLPSIDTVQEAVSQWRLDSAFNHHERLARLQDAKVEYAKLRRHKMRSVGTKREHLPNVKANAKDHCDDEQPQLSRSLGTNHLKKGDGQKILKGARQVGVEIHLNSLPGSRRTSRNLRLRDGNNGESHEKIGSNVQCAKTRKKPTRRSSQPDKFEEWRHQMDLEKLAKIKEKERAAANSEAQPHEDIKHIFKQEEETEVNLETMLGRGYEIRQLAQELKMPLDAVQLAKTVFDSFDVDESGNLDIEEFEKAVARLLELTLDEAQPERVKAMSDWQWWDADAAKPGTIDFHEFLKWYSSNSFKEDLLLTPLQKDLRLLAKSFDVSPDYVEKTKQQFDSCITSGSKDLGFSEFAPLVCKAMKVPRGCELPESRIRFFWSQIDANSSGRIDFSEFFTWWMNYFSPIEGGKEMPIETFYRSVRRVSMGLRMGD